MKLVKVIFITSFFLLFSEISQAQNRLNFDGYGDYVEFNIADIPTPWTFETWVHKNGVTPYSHLMTGADGTSGFRLEQYINSNKVGITKAGVADYSYTYQAPVGGWVHMAIVCDGTNMKLYINGILNGTINSQIDLPMGSISANLFGAGGLYAQVTDMRMWNVALPAGTITTYMNSAIDAAHPNYSDLAHYYNFNEGAGDTLHDSKGTAHGIIHGATWNPIYNNDLQISALLSPAQTVSGFSTSNPVQVRISNVGTDTINSDFNLSYSVDGSIPVLATVNASSTPISPYGYQDISFPNIDLSQSDIHSFKIFHSYGADENVLNDTLVTTSSKSVINLDAVDSFTPGNGEFVFISNITKVKVSYYRDDIFRIQLAPTGEFIENTDSLLTVHSSALYTNVSWSDAGTYYKLETDSTVLRVYKSPFTFALFKKDNSTVIWQEQSPLTFGENTIQKLAIDPSEYFYGCGMQNGYFSHKDKTVYIENDYSNNWGYGSVPNPAPFFMSTKGYGMFRNTFRKGQYDFYATTNLKHEDTYFDAYYFSGGTLKSVLEGYTYVTGRPFMIPRWGLEFGDADCYNDTGTTMDVLNTVAKVYRQNDMPGGWILPNDGYSCGYENLYAVNDSLENYGFTGGLWSENPLNTTAYEVGTASVGVYKLDVALVGPGYKSAFQSGLSAYGGIENNSNRRGYVWTVAGWSGTQRFGTLWSGDQYGTWSNIQMHIPTVIGAGLSAFNCATGDVDGIFGGSSSTYVRDLQWKAFTPAIMVISGWAQYNKQPYVYGGNTTVYNRAALKLKMRLTPYMYSYCREANLTGVPAVRAMVLEYPNDTTTYSATTQYQFMSGEWFLVAPVYKSSTIRDSIYLPEGEWIDYWDGQRFTGPAMLNGYYAPLSKLPLFVKSGAIIPMYPSMLYDNEKPKDTLILDLYPNGISTFRLYEDDGFSQDYRQGEFVETIITLDGPVSGYSQPIKVDVSASVGTYDGMLPARCNKLDVHFYHKPGLVLLNNSDTLTEYSLLADLNAAPSGWFYNPSEKMGITHVKTESIPVNTSFEVKLMDFTFNSVQENDPSGSGIHVYPTPTNGAINLNYAPGLEIKDIRVHGVNGNLVFENNSVDDSGSFSFNLNVKPGVYYIHVNTNKGVIVKEVIISK